MIFQFESEAIIRHNINELDHIFARLIFVSIDELLDVVYVCQAHR